jgi:hypothetical protein
VGRPLTLSKHADGVLGIRGRLDAVGGEELQASLESITQAARPEGDTRTRAQQQADALVQPADNALTSGDLPLRRTVKPDLIVTIDMKDRLGPATGPGAATTGSGATLSAARARWAACGATIIRLVPDPDGQPLDVGRTKRVVPPHLRRAVERRGRHGVCAGCPAPTHWCDVHHLPEVDRRREDLPGELRAALRTAPPRGPPRVPGRTTTRGPMAHPPPRRHRDHPRHAVVVST